ncbi:MAG TPA: TetR family transcriptional regulator, partial [Eubacteriaceae bacterium]|nr:TetR family transcriptional regulator [Eubacteriaceae bacterium]
MDKKKEVRTKILFAAHELFMNYGYTDTSLRMIGQRSGISHTQAIYH